MVLEIVWKYIEEIVRLHGLSARIVSYRYPRFTSHFWRDFQKTLVTRVNISTAYHLQMYGQSERTIRTLEDMLRACTLDWEKSWERHFPLVDFAYNTSSIEVSIRMSPYEALYGQPCRTPLCCTQMRKHCMIGPEVLEIPRILNFWRTRWRKSHSRQNIYMRTSTERTLDSQ